MHHSSNCARVLTPPTHCLSQALTATSGIAFGMTAVSPWVLLAVTTGWWAAGLRDLHQEQHSILRNFPILGRVRYFFETLRPEVRSDVAGAKPRTRGPVAGLTVVRNDALTDPSVLY